MSSNEYQTPDLASVLRTLAGLAHPATQPDSQESPQDYSTPFLPQTNDQPAQSAWQKTPSQVPLEPQVSTTLNTQKTVDPATIIDWKAGLRCMILTIGKHESILHDIRRVRN